MHIDFYYHFVVVVVVVWYLHLSEKYEPFTYKKENQCLIKSVSLQAVGLYSTPAVEERGNQTTWFISK